jgi:hemoglobin
MFNLTSGKTLGAIVIAVALAGGCANEEKADRSFHTSGSREADQRAEQRVAKVQQLRGEGGDGAQAASDTKKSLYDRLGGETGIAAIVDDFVNRALADPRVNWERQGVEYGGLMGFREKSAEWQPTAENVTRMKKHISQFLAIATGGPAHYEGRDMKDVHSGMRITNTQFDAAIGDMKATLDNLRVPTEEQKELLSILESTREQVVEER